MKKKTLILASIGGVATLLLASGVFIYLNNKNATDTAKIVLQEATENDEAEDAETDENEDEETKPQSAFDRAVETLEKPDEKLDNEQATLTKEAIKTLINVVSSTEEGKLTQRREDKNLLTKLSDLKTLKGYLTDGYAFSENDVSVYQSKSENVTQFVFLLKKGSDEVSVTGNFQLDLEQLQIGVFKK